MCLIFPFHYARFPHSTFEWEGIDGSTVLAHFPPADTYNSGAGVGDVLKSCNGHKSKLTSNRSLLLFGHGDGGGGPAVSHLEQLQRLQHCEALPTVKLDSDPNTFFQEVERDHAACRAHNIPPPRWVGELYLELHQGTLTSQAAIKSQNRQCEALLRAVDALLCLCLVVPLVNSDDNGTGNGGHEGVCAVGVKEIQVEVRTLWKDLLLNQFHDVLRKSCYVYLFIYVTPDVVFTENSETASRPIYHQ